MHVQRKEGPQHASSPRNVATPLRSAWATEPPACRQQAATRRRSKDSASHMNRAVPGKNTVTIVLAF